jgi:hypothetical protein
MGLRFVLRHVCMYVCMYVCVAMENRKCIYLIYLTFTFGVESGSGSE